MGRIRTCGIASQARTLLVISALLMLPPSAEVGAWPDESPLPALEVGSISDLDLEAVRQILDQSDDVGAPAVRARLGLTLEGAVKASLENNLGLQIVALEVDARESDVTGARSKFHPVLAIEGSAFETKRAHSTLDRQNEFTQNQQGQAMVRQQVPTGGSVSVGVGYAREFKNEYNEDLQTKLGANLESVSELGGLGIEIRQPLLRGGRIFVARREILDAEYDTEISRAELRSEILNVTAGTKSAYYRAIQALRQIEVIEQALGRDGELIRASDALFEAGRVSKVDVYSAEISQSNNQARLATARADLEIAQNELRKVIGLDAEMQVDVMDLTIPFQPLEIELDDWVARALEDRPEMARMRAKLEKAELAVRVAENDTLPNLEARGGFQPGFDWKSWNWNAGVAFDYPIGNVGPRSRLSRFRALRAQTRREFVRQKRDIELEVRGVEIRLREGIERLKSLILQVENARNKGEIARGRFEMGLASNLDITDADAELVRAESMLLAALVDYASNRALLEARIGGPL
ncbi:MAG: TolC family protein [Myxococcota bacterium]|nr:TolC family protein [Myxococcota bacterium]